MTTSNSDPMKEGGELGLRRLFLGVTGAMLFSVAASYWSGLIFGIGSLLSIALLAWLYLKTAQLFRGRQDALLNSASEKEALREAEKQRRDILQTAMDGFVLVDMQGRLAEVNESYCRMSGYTAEELLAMSITDLEACESADDTASHIRKIRARGEDRFESRHRRKDGSFFDIEVSVKYRPIDGGQLVVFVRDISQKKQAEQALLETEEILRQAIADDPFAIAIFDCDMRYLAASNHWLHDYNVKEADIIGKCHYEVFPEIPQRWRDIHRRCLAGAIERNEDDYFERADGSVTYNRWEIRPWIRLDGKIGGLICYSEVTTERKLAEKARKSVIERYNLATRAAGFGLWDWDIRRNHLVWDERMYELYGIKKEDFSGAYEAWLNAIHPDDKASAIEESERALRGEKEYDTEFRVVWPNGEVRHIKAHGYVVRDADGQPVRQTGVNYDITERKRAEQALNEAARKKDEFLAMLAHELRNPMAAISAAATLLSRPDVGPAKVQFAGNALKQRVVQLGRLIDDLLDVSRIIRGKIELRKENLDLELVIARAVDSSKNLFDDRQQRLVVRVIDPLPVFGDPVRLEQIISNLLTNASRYSDEGQEATLTAFRDGVEAVVQVKDSGIGIPAAILPNIFDAFTQAEKSLERRSGGLGLGLTIVKSLCQLHGGEGVSQKHRRPGKRI